MNSLLTERQRLSDSRSLADQIVVKMYATDPDNVNGKLKYVLASRNLETLRLRMIEKINNGSVQECDQIINRLKENQDLVTECIAVDADFADFVDDT